MLVVFTTSHLLVKYIHPASAGFLGLKNLRLWFSLSWGCFENPLLPLRYLLRLAVAFAAPCHAVAMISC